MERMLKVQMLKFAGPGFNSMSPERRKGEEKQTMEAECALASKQQKDYTCRLGMDVVGVLLTSYYEVQGRIDLARR